MEEFNHPLLIKYRVEDGPITRLGLSPRAFNMLSLNGIRMISALADKDTKALVNLK